MLNTISKPVDRFKFFTIYGGAGIGKTNLAATFPKPIFIRFEDGMQSIPNENRPDAFPVAHSFNDAATQLLALLNEQHDYKTVVIDSITKAERIFIEEIVKTSSKEVGTNATDAKALAKAAGGWGAGYQILSNYHQRIRNGCGMLAEQKNMNIVFIGHAEIEPVDLPDMVKYQRYGLKMNKQSLAHYVDDVDLVGFLRLETFVMTDDNKKAKARSSGERILQCTSAASSISKNRMGIADDLAVQFGINPLSQFLNNIGE
jgi:hypothetical protein